MNAPSPISQEDWKAAEQMHLRSEPCSPQAHHLVETMLAGLVFPAPTKLLKPSTVERRRKALGALLADLLKPPRHCGSHGMKRDDFPAKALGFGFDVFLPLKDAMVAAGFLSFEPGRQRLVSISPFAGGPARPHNAGGWVSRFCLTPAALAHAEAAGVSLDAWADHWCRSASLKPTTATTIPASALVVRRSSNTRKGAAKIKGRDLEVDMADPAVVAILRDLEEHNAFALQIGVEGIDFIGLRRIFNDGEAADFAWRTGGRFYSVRSVGLEPYENMPGPDRRRHIRLDGQSVCSPAIRMSGARQLG